MGIPPRAIIITVPKIRGIVSSDVSRSASPVTRTKLDINSVQNLENRLLLRSDLHSTMNDRRKKKFSHMTYEEKLHRKKLKNRVAAQTSRDRKKAKMDDLERSNQTLEEQNAILIVECEMLRNQNARLTETNDALEKKLAERLSSTTSCQSCSAKLTSSSTITPHTPGPAESFGSFPLLKGWGLWVNRGLLVRHKTSLVRIWLLMSLVSPLSLTYWKTWTTWMATATCKTWQTACLKMRGVLLMLKVQNHPNMLRWWGKHQKTWNPIEQLQRIAMIAQ